MSVDYLAIGALSLGFFTIDASIMKIVQVPKLTEDLNEAQLVLHVPTFSHQKVI